MRSINIFQKTWAFTTADSQKTEIRTAGFGPCYVVTFTSGKFAAMAHIDSHTDVDSMTAIFNKFVENAVNLKDVKVVILGGWKDNEASFQWGNKVIKKIEDAGFTNVSTTQMFKKIALTEKQQKEGILPAEVPRHYQLGARVVATNGKTFLIHESRPDLEKEQIKQNRARAAEAFKTRRLRDDFPLTQIV
jgi:hypothetical protein